MSKNNWIVCLAIGAAVMYGLTEQRACALDVEQQLTVATAPTVEQIQAGIQSIQDAKDVDDATRTKVLDMYQQALTEVELAKKWNSQVVEFVSGTVSVPDRLQATKNELATTPENTVAAIPADASLAQLERNLQQKEAEAAERKKQLAQLADEPKRRSDRRVEIPRLIAAARERLAEIQKELAAPTPAQEPAPLITARRTLLEARRAAIQGEIEAVEKELGLYEACVELLPLRRDLAKRREKVADQEAKAWRTAVENVRKREVAQQSIRAENILDQVPRELRPLAELNLSLAEQRKRVDARLQETRSQLETSKERLDSVRDQYRRVAAQENAIGLTGALGMLLRNQLLTLPDWRALRRESKERQMQIGDLQVKLLELQELRSDMADVDEQVELLLTERFGAAHAPTSDTKAVATHLVSARREYLDGLLVDNNMLFEALVNLDSAQQQLIVLAEQYEDYIDERVLWTRSASRVSTADLPAAGEATSWLLQPQRWQQVSSRLINGTLEAPLPTLLVIGFCVMLVVFRLRLRRIIRTSGEEAILPSSQSYIPTCRAFFATALVSALWPGLLFFFAWRLAALPESVELARPLSAGLFTAVGVFLPFEVWRQISRHFGLAHAHFGCDDHSLRLLRRHLRWLILAIVPLVALVGIVHESENPRWESSLGRFAFIVLLLLVALFVQRVLSPASGVLRDIIDRRRGGWLDRLQVIWYPLAILTPIALATLAAAGYFYTASELALRLHSTACLILTLLFGGGLCLRWILVSQRRIASEQAQIRVEQAASAAVRDHATERSLSQVSALPPADNDLIDLLKVDLQTRRLIRSFGLLAGIFGAWLIWSDVIPALGMLERVPLWDATIQVAKTVTLSDGTTSVESIPSVQAITLANLAFSLLILLMTFVAIKNIPGLLELAILRHLPLDTALRFAITTVTRYALIVVGLVWCLGTIGWGWSKIQWLLAAVSVGLGFGLQEIFANFISGLILLFERPLRAGDVVTVGDVTGKVVQIRTRATVIQDWDRKELIVPNKEFITGRLLNWTLSDPVNRIVVQVGVAYGSDVARVREIILSAATDNPLILSDPAPSVTFDLFADSSLNFTLRAFLPNLENRLAVIHDIHASIHKQLAAAGIEIAFPQRDLHLRTIESPLQVVPDEKTISETEYRDRKSA